MFQCFYCCCFFNCCLSSNTREGQKRFVSLMDFVMQSVSMYKNDSEPKPFDTLIENCSICTPITKTSKANSSSASYQKQQQQNPTSLNCQCKTTLQQPHLLSTY